jgi:hypothetical protein
MMGMVFAAKRIGSPAFSVQNILLQNRVGCYGDTVDAQGEECSGLRT